MSRIALVVAGCLVLIGMGFVAWNPPPSQVAIVVPAGVAETLAVPEFFPIGCMRWPLWAAAIVVVYLSLRRKGGDPVESASPRPGPSVGSTANTESPAVPVASSPVNENCWSFVAHESLPPPLPRQIVSHPHAAAPGPSPAVVHDAPSGGGLAAPEPPLSDAERFRLKTQIANATAALAADDADRERRKQTDPAYLAQQIAELRSLLAAKESKPAKEAT